MLQITEEITLRGMMRADWPQAAAIYAEGIATGIATFETAVPEWDHWDVAHIAQCRIAAVAGPVMTGWAAISAVSGRCVYAGVAEVCIYVGEHFRAKGVGRMLLSLLIRQSEDAGFWTLQAGIFPENQASLRLHKSLGFREVGFREKIGMLNGIWRDVVLLERRSLTTG